MKKALIIQLARFGDLIQTKRLVASLAHDGAEVHLCVDRSLVALAKLVYPEAVVHPIQAHGGLDAQQGTESILTKTRQIFGGLARIDFNAIYNLNFSPLNFALAGLFDPGQVCGYRWSSGQSVIGTWPSMAMRWSRSRRIGINIMDFWAGYAPKMLRPDRVNPVAEPGGGGVGVVLAGRESRRSLPPKVLARAVAVLWEVHGRGPVKLLGSRAETRVARQVFKELPDAVQKQTVDLSGKTDWTGLAEAVTGLDALLTPDTGTMHLAAHLGVPVLATFLSSAWCFETGPYGAGHTVFQAVEECLPCLETQPCPHSVRCLQPFDSSLFLRYLATHDPAHAPDGMLVLRSGFDELGQTYEVVAGEDVNREQRDRFRAFIANHLHVVPRAGAVETGFRPDRNVAEQLYLERDWIV